MKNTEKSKPTKKKILTYYLILAASLLVVAAITVGIIFAVKPDSSLPNDSIDNGNQGGNDGDNNGDNNGDNDGDKNPDDDKKPGDGDSTDVSGDYVFVAPVGEVNLTQAHVFGYDKTLDRYRFHEGMDFTAEAGTNVLAAADGKVTDVTLNDYLFGATVTIEHADGVTTVYKFLDPNEGLKAGDAVKGGTVIGKIAAATGVENAEGAHLHFEVLKNGVMQDPDDYLNIISK